MSDIKPTKKPRSPRKPKTPALVGTPIQIRGQARHRFWGEYSSVVAIEVMAEGKTPEERAPIAAKLAKALGDTWEPGTKITHCAAATMTSAEGDRFIAKLAAWGLPAKEIAKVFSVKYSIDHGEEFSGTITVPDEATEPEPAPAPAPDLSPLASEGREAQGAGLGHEVAS